MMQHKVGDGVVWLERSVAICHGDTTPSPNADAASYGAPTCCRFDLPDAPRQRIFTGCPGWIRSAHAEN
jgi:hypothetical protein